MNLIAAAAAALVPLQGLVADASFPAATSGPVLRQWLETHSAIRPGEVVANGGGRVVAVTRKAPAPAPSRLVRITIRTEIITPDAAAQAGARSETGELEIDCAGGKARPGVTQQYSLPNLTGSLRIKPGGDAWIPAAPNTTLSRMIEAACAWPRSAQAAPAAAPAPDLSGQGASEAGAAPRAPQEAPSARPDPARAAPAGPAAVSVAGGFGSWAQIAVDGSRQGAQAVLDQWKAAHPEDGQRPTAVEALSAGGQTYYLALVGGFPDSAQAAAFCQAAGPGCVVRQR